MASVGAGAEGPRDPAAAIEPNEVAEAGLDHACATRALQQLIQQLDAEQYADRNDATRRLLEQGPACVPLLVASLGAESRETRFRAAEILRGAFTFDEVAPRLIEGLAKPYRATARAVLRDRSLAQVEEAAQLENTRLLFAFWGTDIEALRRRVFFELAEIQRPEQARTVVAPLLGLQDKVRQFHEMLSGLQALSLTCDHQQGAGFTVAETLARGLFEENSKKIDFARRYGQSLHDLVTHMRRDGQTHAAARKEVADRASMSDGAARFLVRLLDERSEDYRVLSSQLGVPPETLREEFFRGLAAADSRECYRCVGKVHIADMLLEALRRWPESSQEGVVRSVVDGVVATIPTGDKPKALALLDALEGCAELPARGLPAREELGGQLARRLCLAALAAPNSRAYHPVRAVHDRIVRTVAAGAPAASELFPRSFVERYLSGEAAAVSDAGRMELERYATILEELQRAGVSPDDTDAHAFLLEMSRHVHDGSTRLADGLAEVTRTLEQTKTLTAEQRHSAIAQSLRESLR